MWRPLPHVLALLLGVGSALLVACGGGTKGGIPPASAGELKSQIADVQQAVDGGRCEAVSGRLRRVDASIDALPSTVDERLRQSLRDASGRLHDSALNECDARTATTQTQTAPTETQTQAPTETQTQTAPTETQTQTAPAATTPSPTTTRSVPAPTTTAPPAPPAEPPAPPPGTPGGGASPEVPR